MGRSRQRGDSAEEREERAQDDHDVADHSGLLHVAQVNGQLRLIALVL